MKKLLPLIFAIVVGLPTSVFAQLDTEFWFVAPKIWIHHAPGPCYFMIATGDQPANVLIERPADPANGWSDQLFNVPANSIQRVGINENLLYPQNHDTIPDQVSQYGIRITASTPVTVYYENSYNGNNPDIYALKGRNALGTEFVTPFQNSYGNVLPSVWDSFSDTDNNRVGDPKSGMDIVATEDGTEVYVVPTAPVVKSDGGWYDAGDTIRFTLDRGETYRIKAVGRSAQNHLMGTVVRSTKNIAISTFDDSVHMAWCQDQIGDQLVPTTVVGTEYVIMKSLANVEDTDTPDRIIIQPTEDNTEITVNFQDAGTASITRNIDEPLNVALEDSSAYISSDKPVYVFHLGGHGCEIGGAIMPPLDNCAGSQEVQIVRSPPGNNTPGANLLMLNIVVAAGGEDDFTVEIGGTPQAGLIGTWADVPGTGGAWRYMRRNYSTTEIGVEQNIKVTNSTSLFQLGLINGERWDGGAKYGYFSSFSNLGISENDYVCTDATATLTADGLSNTYIWSTGETTQSIDVTTAGTYSVTATLFNGCQSTESIPVDVGNTGIIDLGSDFVLCDGTESFDATPIGHTNFIWNNGETTGVITVADSGTYAVTATGENMCAVQGEIHVAQVARPTLRDTNLCHGASSILDAGVADTYSWSTGASTQTISVASAGGYDVTVSTAGCIYEAQMTLDVSTLPPLPLVDSTVCADGSVDIDLTSFLTHIWSDGSSAASRTITDAGNYGVTTTDNLDCIYTGEMDLTVNPLPDIQFAAFDTCFIDGQTLTTTVAYDKYLWADGGSVSEITLTEGGAYAVTVEDANGCINSSDTLDLTLRTPVQVNDTASCFGSEIVISSPVLDSYEWSTGGSDQSITVTTGGVYGITVTEDGCESQDDFTVTYTDDPGVPLVDSTICTGDTLELTAPGAGDFVWADGPLTAEREFFTAGLYAVTATAPNGCEATGSFTLSFHALPTPALADFDTCFAMGEILVADQTYDAYEWSTGSDNDSVTVDQAGYYTLTVTDGNGCDGQVTASITIRSVVAVADTSSCFGSSITVTASTGDTFIWSNGESTAAVDITAAGDYSVTVSEGGCVSQDSVNVSFDADPGIALADSAICAGDSALITVPGTGDFVWSDGADTAAQYVSTAGLYGVTLTESNGCVSTGGFTLSLNALPTPTFSPIDACAATGSEVSLTEDYSEYAWSDGASVSTTTVGANGDYSVTVTDASGCLGQATVTINALPVPSLDLSVVDSLRCSGEDTDLIVEVADDMGMGPLDIYLNIGGTDTVLTQVSNGQVTVDLGTAHSGVIAVDSVVLNNGCGVEDALLRVEQAVAEVAGVPEVDIATDGIYCPSGSSSASVTFALLEGELPWSLSYSGPEGDVHVTDLDESSFTINDVRDGQYALLSVTDGNKCHPDLVLPDTIDVDEGPAIDLGIDITASYSCEGPTFIIASQAGEVTWAVEGDDAFGMDVTVVMGLGDSKVVSYTVSDGGCEADSTVILTAPTEFVYSDWLSEQNVFTPNADAQNDYFDPDNNDLFNTCAQMKVYNRWGTLIFETTTDAADWDGESFVGAAPEGTYYAILEIDGIGQFSRSVTLFR